MTWIRAISLSKRYGETLALDGLDLTVNEEARSTATSNPTGAGKTTTIRLLLGLHRPSSGRAELFGVDAVPVLVPHRVHEVVQSHGRPALRATLHGH